MMYDSGDIVIVPFPFSDLAGIKQRPVLVLSSKMYNASCQDMITCGITSNPFERAHSVKLSRRDVLDGSIPVDSRIKSDKLFTLAQGLIKKKMGRAKPEVIDAVYSSLIKIIQR